MREKGFLYLLSSSSFPCWTSRTHKRKTHQEKHIWIQFPCDRYLEIYSVCFTISLLSRLIQLSGFQCEKCISGKPFSKWMADAEKIYKTAAFLHSYSASAIILKFVQGVSKVRSDFFFT